MPPGVAADLEAGLAAGWERPAVGTVVRRADFDAARDCGFCGDDVRPADLGCALGWVRLGVGEAVPERVSRRRAARARERRERLEKDITPRYYLLRFQHGQANVGDC